ncbi:hypothetical protein AGABI2DRAFT_191514 [Agaricus bisporus var. bisporus H97]|uniref:hypothetical protein n=1 Tax=Agaricus bisporus var. bisporus (strain H97 / ATCC MYA-4626 / FGSC 10389) TaxID=936046 RepID=UPI00029F7122|nr:hypothetical protein AGABI2DRAFT_191514 [Agaricus bisporus var. bisporus H97]EKV49531.1 hypothetical protein AGABI2DRAFT_191514 [Agaricus bisporus var. bisporus H97]
MGRDADELARLHERNRLLERSLRDARDSLKLKDAELDRLRERKSTTTSLARPRRRSSSVATHSDTSSSVVDEELARARTADAYLTRTDNWSGAQILQAVHDINSEILQFAAGATEAFTFDRNARPSSSRAIQAMHDTSARLGSSLARILANRDHSQDPILVQLALQGCLTICITRALSTFCVGFPSKSDSLLHQIYHRMALAEPQPTSSKWRSLTHQHIHAMYPTLIEYSTTELTDTIFRWSSDILLISGCISYTPSSSTPSLSSSSSSSSSTTTTTALRSRFTDHIRRLSKSVIKLSKVLREEILSTSFELLAVDPTNHPPSTPTTTSAGGGGGGPLFHDRTMIDAFSDYGQSRGSVLATTELGLRCVTRMGTREAVASEEEVLLEQRVLLMPKVVLESVLDILDR